MNEEILSIVEEQPKSDYLPYNDEFVDYMYKFLDGGKTIFNIGDLVEFKYPMNLDGLNSEERKIIKNLVGKKGIIKKFVYFNDNRNKYWNYNKVQEDILRPVINFGDYKLNEINNWYTFYQLQFVKSFESKGLRRYCNILDESSNNI